MRAKLLGSTVVLALVLVVAVLRQFREQENPEDWEFQSEQTPDTPSADRRPAARTVFGGEPNPIDEIDRRDQTHTPKERGARSSRERGRTNAVAARASFSHPIPADVQAFLNRWRSTLIVGDVAGQAALYADRVDKFFTKRNVTREDVRREKARMLSRYPEFHKYELHDVRIERLNGDRAVVTLRKDWDARGRGRFSGSEQQRLTLSKQSGSWQIVGEEETKVHWVRRS